MLTHFSTGLAGQSANGGVCGASRCVLEALARSALKDAGKSEESNPQLFQDTHGKPLEEPTFMRLPADGDINKLLPPLTAAGKLVWQPHNVPSQKQPPKRSMGLVFKGWDNEAGRPKAATPTPAPAPAPAPAPDAAANAAAAHLQQQMHQQMQQMQQMHQQMHQQMAMQQYQQQQYQQQQYQQQHYYQQQMYYQQQQQQHDPQQQQHYDPQQQHHYYQPQQYQQYQPQQHYYQQQPEADGSD